MRGRERKREKERERGIKREIESPLTETQNGDTKG